MYSTNTLRFNTELCNNCIICSTVCPHGVIERTNGKVRISYTSRCMECGACQINCPLGAIQVESGTGCAAAMMYSALTGKKEVCCG